MSDSFRCRQMDEYLGCAAGCARPGCHGHAKGHASRAAGDAAGRRLLLERPRRRDLRGAAAAQRRAHRQRRAVRRSRLPLRRLLLARRRQRGRHAWHAACHWRLLQLLIGAGGRPGRAGWRGAAAGGRRRLDEVGGETRGRRVHGRHRRIERRRKRLRWRHRPRARHGRPGQARRHGRPWRRRDVGRLCRRGCSCRLSSLHSKPPPQSYSFARTLPCTPMFSAPYARNCSMEREHKFHTWADAAASAMSASSMGLR